MIWLEDDLPEPPAHQGNEHEKLYCLKCHQSLHRTSPPPPFCSPLRWGEDTDDMSD